MEYGRVGVLLRTKKVGSQEERVEDLEVVERVAEWPVRIG